MSRGTAYTLGLQVNSGGKGPHEMGNPSPAQSWVSCGVRLKTLSSQVWKRSRMETAQPLWAAAVLLDCPHGEKVFVYYHSEPLLFQCTPIVTCLCGMRLSKEPGSIFSVTCLPVGTCLRDLLSVLLLIETRMLSAAFGSRAHCWLVFSWLSTRTPSGLPLLFSRSALLNFFNVSAGTRPRRPF